MTDLTPMSLVLFRPPAITPELCRELDQVVQSPLDYVPRWHADAEAAADHLRIGMRPAMRELADQWLVMLATVVANAPTEVAAMHTQGGAIWLLCRDFPAAVWSEESLIAYCDRSPFWPKPAEMRQFMRERADTIARELAGLDRIAKAPRWHPKVRGSSAYLDSLIASGVSVPEWVAEAEPVSASIRPPERSVAEQLAALGVPPAEAKP